jgi:protein SCO1/2
MISAGRTVAAVLVGLSVLGSPCLTAAAASEAGVLLDQTGTPVPASELDGHYLLVYFGYTSCPDICPTTLTLMSDVLTTLEPETANLRAYFVTVDPAHDTVAALHEYLRHFHPRLTGLTGSPEDLAAVARKFGVVVHPGAPHGDIEHGVFIYFVGPNGQVLQIFHPRDSSDIILVAIRAAMAQPKNAGGRGEK